MSFAKGHVAVHLDMHVDGDVVAYFARTQIVETADSVHALDYFGDFFCFLFGKGAFEQLVDCRADYINSGLNDEAADDSGGNRVEDSSTLAEEHCSGDADQRSYRREGVAAVMPGICFESVGIKAFALSDSISVKDLFGDD